MNKQTHCKYGHPYTPENTYTREEGWRQCRTCMREKWRKQHGQNQRYTERGYIAKRAQHAVH